MYGETKFLSYLFHVPFVFHRHVTRLPHLEKPKKEARLDRAYQKYRLPRTSCGYEPP